MFLSQGYQKCVFANLTWLRKNFDIFPYECIFREGKQEHCPSKRFLSMKERDEKTNLKKCQNLIFARCRCFHEICMVFLFIASPKLSINRHQDSQRIGNIVHMLPLNALLMLKYERNYLTLGMWNECSAQIKQVGFL